VRPRPNRPKSLVLVSRSRFGKTEWARSLGSHAFNRGAWDAEVFKYSYDYIVLDDFDFSYMKTREVMLKAFFGCQGAVKITGKYIKTFTINTACPVICLMNHDQEMTLRDFFISPWGIANVDRVFLEEPLF